MAHGDRIRVTKVVPTLQCGGTEKQFLALVGRLDQRRFEIECACLRQLGPFVSRLADHKVPLREYPIRTFRGGASIFHQLRFAAHLFKRRVHVVHSYSFYGNVFAVPAARLAGVPVVIASIRDRGVYLSPAQLNLQRHVCRFADHILVNAESLRAWLIDEGYDASKISIIRNGVEHAANEPRSRVAAVCDEFGLPADSAIVAVVGRIAPSKGLEYFLDAAAVVAKRCATARFLIVGEPASDVPRYLDDLRARAERNGIADRVIFAGLRHDIPELLAGATMAVLPSLNEGLSNALLESMAAGLPVVATRVGGTPEAIDGGVNGLLVPSRDAYALAESMTTLLDDPRRAATLGLTARRTVDERFSMARMTAATERLYLDLLERRSRKPAVAAPDPRVSWS